VSLRGAVLGRWADDREMFRRVSHGWRPPWRVRAWWSAEYWWRVGLPELWCRIVGHRWEIDRLGLHCGRCGWS